MADLAKHVVFVCFYSPGDNTVGYRRCLYFANSLIALGLKVTYVTRVSPDYQAELINPKIRFVYAQAGGSVAEEGNARASSFRLLGKKYFGQLFHPWLFSSAKLFVRSLKEVEVLPSQQTVFIGSHPSWHAFLVAWALSRYHRGKLILDYRDLFSGSHLFSKNFIWFERVIERFFLKNSDAVITVSAPWLDYITHPRKYLVPNGFDSRVFSDVGNVSVQSNTIRYFGSISFADRVPAALIHLVRARVDLQFEFFGDCHLLKPLVKECNNVRFFGPVPYAVAIRKMCSAGANLIVSLPDHDVSRRGMLQTKAFEYMAAGRPILIVGDNSGSSATHALIRPSGLVYDIDDFYSGANLERPSSSIDRAYIQKFDRASLVVQIEQIIEEICAP